MSRMTFCLAMIAIFASHAQATDVSKYPPGQKPYARPKAPCPNGVLAEEACFGYFNTKWTQWHQACGPEVATGQAVSRQSSNCCASKGIILFEADSTAKPAPSQTVVKPAPESIPPSAVPPKPMPPVKK